MFKQIVFCFAIFVTLAAAHPHHHQNGLEENIKLHKPMENLPACNVNASSVTVSGLSAGAFMAVQFHVAYSSIVKAAGIIAGGPYYCAKDQFTTAIVSCMTEPVSIFVDALIAATDKFSSDGKIDSTNNLAKSNVWLYSGTKDTVVKPEVMQKLQQFYQHYITQGKVETDFTQVSEHGFPTLNYGEMCTHLGSPYILKCNYDAAGKILTNAYGVLQPAVEPIESNLIQFSQDPYSPNSYFLTTGYVYIPTACRNATNGVQCKLHIDFHGCEQSTQFLHEKQYVEHTGLNGYAESNNIVVLYPQCGKNMMKENPNGCFDWWGYTNADYAVKDGPQMKAVYNMIQALGGPSLRV